jgi:HSP20 family protein
MDHEKGRVYHYVERNVGCFTRSIPLPAAVLEDKVTADCKDGVLTITLPKKDVAKSQKIKINSK